MPTLQESIAKVLGQIQAGSLNEPQPDFRVQAEVPSAQMLLEEGARNDPFRLEQIVKMDKPSQPKVDWAALAMVAANNQRMIQQPAPATIGPTLNGQRLPSEIPNPLAGGPVVVKDADPLAGVVQRQPITMGWRTPEAIAQRAVNGASGQFDAPTPLMNMGIRMAGPAIGGGIGLMTGPAAPVAAPALAALGGVVSSQIAQGRETAQGTRAGVNPLEMYVEGATSMLPMATPSKALPLLPQVPKIAASALGVGAVSDAAMQLAETGSIDPARLAEQTLLTGALGTGATVGAQSLARGADSDAAARLMSEERGSLPLGPGPDDPNVPSPAIQTKLPAEARGLMDPLTPLRDEAVSPGQRPAVPDSMTPSGLTAAERRADDIRIGKAIRRHNVTDDEEALITSIHREGADRNFEQHRGMHTSWAQTDMEASVLVPEIKLTKGTTMNAAELTALRRSAHGVVSQSVDISNTMPRLLSLEAKAAAGDVAAAADLRTALDEMGVDSIGAAKLREQEAFLKAQVAVKSLAGVKSELARSLNSLKSFQQKRNMGDAEFLVKAIEAGGDGQKAMQALRGMRNPDGTPNRLMAFKYIRSLAKPNAETYWHWYARTAYLSGLSTQWRNLSGNAVNFGIEALAVRPAAAALDSFNANRTVTATEMRAMGTTSGFLDGLQKASYFFKNGFTKDDVDAFDNLPPEVFGGALVPNSIGRAMGAVDQFFRTVGFHVELHRMAIAQAHGEGLRGPELMARATQLVDDPTITPELVKRAERYAAGLTFQDNKSSANAAAMLGNVHQLVKGVDAWKQRGVDELYERGLKKLGWAGDATYGLLSFPPSVIIAPFINTPFNILKRAAQYTPAGLLAAKGGDRDRMMVAGRGAVGTAMMASAVGLWMNGRMTGKAPQPGTPEAEAWYDGRQPYSIKIGDRWVPYSYLGPVGMVLGATANYAEAVSKDPKNVLNYFGQLMVQGGRTAVDATFLRGMQSILMAVADDSTEGRLRDKFANQTATGLLPLAGAMRDVRNVVDPTLRKPEGMKEQVMASIPGLSDNVEPRINATGEEIQRGSTIFPTRKDEDPVRAELLRLYRDGKDGYYRDPTEAGSKLLGKINTAIKQHNKSKGASHPLLASVPRPLVTAYAKRYGEESERRLSQIVRMPAYQALSDDQRRVQIEKAKRRITEMIDREFSRRFIEMAVRQ